MEAWRRLARLAARQHGVVTRAQCLSQGIAPMTLARHVRRFGWQPLHPGVFALPGTADDAARQAMAALLAIGQPALVTGAAALHLLGVLDRRPSVIAVLVPNGRALPSPSGVQVVRTVVFDAVRPRRRQSLRLARAPRAIADHAPLSDPLALARLMGRACGLREASLSAFARELTLRKRFPGRTHLRRAVAMLTGELTHSGTERAARRRLRDAGIEVFPRPYPVVHGGRVVAEIDVAIPGLRYGIEIDGPHHDLPQQAAADKQRDRRLRSLGWTVDRFPVELIDAHAEQFVAEVRRTLRLLGRRSLDSYRMRYESNDQP